MDVRVVPTRTHALLDYTKAPALTAVPKLLRLDPWTAAAVAPRVAAAGGTVMAALSDHELAVRRVIPMRVHLLADGVAGLALALAPWLDGSARRGARYWLPHALVGAGDVALALTTKLRPKSRTERLKDAVAALPAPIALAVPAVALLALGGVALHRSRRPEADAQPPPLPDPEPSLPQVVA
ncbi:MAG TPA: hypothetical protein VM290_07840 [Gaiellaceae bacterium]|nr:hypothetical protein [Gaiellaceae bacterium]